jgi:hypothetical protein
MLSLNDLDAKTKSETPVEIEYVMLDGTETGVILHILGDESQTVRAVTTAELEKRQQQMASIEALSTGVRGSTPTRSVEADLAMSNRLTACRLVGWEGIKEEWSPANALKLVSSNSDVAAFVLEVSKGTSRFLQLKSKGSSPTPESNSN